jgi:endonuclease/exonuclease/phosphatase family metal-dependent hydrolase
MRLATWNLNNRVGKVRFRPKAADAAVALGADLVVYTEYFPQQHHQEFCQVLAKSGLENQLLSHEPREIANRTLMASRLFLKRDGLALPDFDEQFRANVVAAHIPTLGLRVLGLRVPAYHPRERDLLLSAWKWLESAAAQLLPAPAVILGDLNVQAAARTGAGASLRRIRESGWQRAAPVGGSSYFGRSGARSEIDHVLVTPCCRVRGAEYVVSVGGFALAGTPDALSDHAALVADLEIDQVSQG